MTEYTIDTNGFVRIVGGPAEMRARIWHAPDGSREMHAGAARWDVSAIYHNEALLSEAIDAALTGRDPDASRIECRTNRHDVLCLRPGRRD